MGVGRGGNNYGTEFRVRYWLVSWWVYRSPGGGRGIVLLVGELVGIVAGGGWSGYRTIGTGRRKNRQTSRQI